MAVDFRKLLSKPLDDVKRPPALPAGTYYGTIAKHEFVESRFAQQDTGEKIGQIKYHFKAVRPGEDIDQQLLADIDLNKRAVSAELPLEGGNEWITKTFLENLGIATSGRGWGETCPEALNHEVMFTVTQRMDKNNPEVMYNDVRSLRPVQQLTSGVQQTAVA